VTASKHVKVGDEKLEELSLKVTAFCKISGKNLDEPDPSSYLAISIS
jgi:hypothetical protein